MRRKPSGGAKAAQSRKAARFGTEVLAMIRTALSARTWTATTFEQHGDWMKYRAKLAFHEANKRLDMDQGAA